VNGLYPRIKILEEKKGEPGPIGPIGKIRTI
jgi:hypothetical protein